MRIYRCEYSVALGYKTPICKTLNEQDAQQGGRGTEAYRLISTLSALL